VQYSIILGFFIPYISGQVLHIELNKLENDISHIFSLFCLLLAFFGIISF